MQQYPNMQQQPMGMPQYPMQQQPMGMQHMGMQPMGIKPPMSIGMKILYGCIIVICLLIVYYVVYGTLPFGLMGTVDKAANVVDKAANAANTAADSAKSAAGSAANTATGSAANTAAGSAANTVTNPTGPSFLGCYSSAKNAYNGNRIATDFEYGKTNVTDCNAAAKKAGKNYFGMSYWQGSGYDSTGKKNIGKANCVWASDNLDLAKLTSYTGAPGGSKNNAPGCPENGPFTNECISNDTVNACAVNLGPDVPPNSGKLGGGWINALYKTF